MMDIGGINLGGVNPEGNDANANKAEEQVPAEQKFNPDAPYMQAAQSQASVLARLNLKKKKGTGLDDESDDNEGVEHEIDIPGLGLVKVSEDQLKGFQKRVEAALIRQEEEMLQIVDTFAGNEKTLRNTIGSVLMAS